METINVKIDISTPRGRKLVRELHGKKGIEIENPVRQEVTGKTCTVDEAYDIAINILKKNYREE